MEHGLFRFAKDAWNLRITAASIKASAHEGLGCFGKWGGYTPVIITRRTDPETLKPERSFGS